MVRIKKLVHENRIWLVSGNIGFLTSKLVKLVDTKIKTMVSILYMQETKLAGEKTTA